MFRYLASAAFSILLFSNQTFAQEAEHEHGRCEVTFTIYPLDVETPLPEAPPRGGFNIIINPGPALSGNAAALAAFNRAAQQWESFITDPITVNISADLANLGAGVLGSTNVVTLSTSNYSTLRTRWIADADADDDILLSLPTSPAFTVPAGFGVSTSTLGAKAAFKAIGGFGDLDGQFGANDATITFNTQFTFDFDNSNGVTGTDFETVAAHEIGHALGYSSTVDIVDIRLANGQTDTVAPSLLDFLRFLNNSASDPASAANFSTFTRDLRTNVDAISDFIASVGMEAAENRMATGRFTGDGDQASHWKADEDTGIHIGVMDPTLSPGVFFLLSDADKRAIDLIGYDVIVAPDCNANGIPDADDIAMGTSEDCNANETPDECDLLEPVLTSYSQTPNAAIPDNNPSGISRTISVPDSATITDLDVALHINHTWQGDLVITLSHGGVTRTLMNRPGEICNPGSGGYAANNFGTAGNLLVLDDSALVSIDCYTGAGTGNGGIANYAGPAMPTQSLSAFNGLDSAGDWTLHVSDHFSQDTGTLVTWRLDIRTPAVDCNANGVPDECEPDCNGNGIPDACDGGCGAPAVSVVGAVARKPNGSGPGGVCDLALIPGVRSDSRQGGVTQVRVAFDAAPGGPGPNPVTIQQATCAAPAYAPYSGASVVSASVSGSELVLNFTPGLENARRYRIDVGSEVTSVGGQFVELRGLVGDANGDGSVNALDRGVVIGAWTGAGGFSCNTDFNNDGSTNALDRGIVIGAWTGAQNCAP